MVTAVSQMLLIGLEIRNMLLMYYQGSE